MNVWSCIALVTFTIKEKSETKSAVVWLKFNAAAMTTTWPWTPRRRVILDFRQQLGRPSTYQHQRGDQDLSWPTNTSAAARKGSTSFRRRRRLSYRNKCWSAGASHCCSAYREALCSCKILCNTSLLLCILCTLFMSCICTFFFSRFVYICSYFSCVFCCILPL